MGLSVNKGGEELGIAIGGKDECLGIRSFVCLDFVKWNGKNVNDGIVATGTLHRLQQDGQYIQHHDDEKPYSEEMMNFINEYDDDDTYSYIRQFTFE